MKKNYQKILNNIGDTYKQYIDISLEESDLTTVNINLDEFAHIELKLKNSTKDIDESLDKELKDLSSMSLVEIKEVQNGYLLSTMPT
ncbi:MAG: hypothetical protein ACI4PU_10690 [Intestinibacter sp.]